MNDLKNILSNKQIEQLLTQPCLICGAPGAAIGVYHPADNGASFGAPKGKTRLVSYTLCTNCSDAHHTTKEWAEEIIHIKLGDTKYTPDITVKKGRQ